MTLSGHPVATSRPGASGLDRCPAGQAPDPPAGEVVRRILVGRTVARVERDLILDTLDHCRGNRTHAARLLGISLRTLRNRLADYVSTGIEVAEPGGTRSTT